MRVQMYVSDILPAIKNHENAIERLNEQRRRTLSPSKRRAIDAQIRDSEEYLQDLRSDYKHLKKAYPQLEGMSKKEAREFLSNLSFTHIPEAVLPEGYENKKQKNQASIKDMKKQVKELKKEIKRREKELEEEYDRY